MIEILNDVSSALAFLLLEHVSFSLLLFASIVLEFEANLLKTRLDIPVSFDLSLCSFVVFLISCHLLFDMYRLFFQLLRQSVTIIHLSWCSICSSSVDLYLSTPVHVEIWSRLR